MAVMDLPHVAGGRYRELEEIGRGAAGAVYRAYDAELGRWVALKVLVQSEWVSPGARERFRREGRAMAGLAHPNVVTVYDVGEDHGRPYLVMELVEGGSLAALMSGRAPLKSVVGVLEQAARGVAAAHERGIVHRDLKPGNILVARDGRAKVGDFGLAQVSRGRADLTKTGTAVGTPLYMAPEQAMGRLHAISARTDVYALGVILYEILTGKPPHVADSVQDLYVKIVNEDPVAPRDVNASAPHDLETVCLKAMRKDPLLRYPGGREFADDLARWSAGEPVHARRPAFSARLLRAVARRRAAVGASLLVGAALAVVAGVLIIKSREDARLRAERAGESAQRRARAEAESRARTHLESGRRVVEQMRLAKQEWSCDREKLLGLAERAQMEYEKVFREVPEHPEALLGIGRAWTETGDVKKALASFERSIAASPQFAAPVLERARVRLDEYVRARMRAERDGRVPEEMPDLRRRIREDIERVREWTRGSPEAHFGDAVLAYADEQYDEAVRKFAAYLLQAPTDANALFWHGTALNCIDRHEEALQYFDRALRFNARSAVAYVNRGIARHAIGRFDEAIDDYARAIEIAPSTLEAYFGRASSHLMRGDADSAMRDLDQALQLHPRWAMAMSARGLVREAKGDRAGARADYEDAIAILSTSPNPLVNRGNWKLDEGDVTGAVADFGEALRLDPRHTSALVNRSRAHLEAGDRESARRDLDEAIRLRPRFSEAYVNRSALRREAGDIDGALNDAAEAVRLAPWMSAAVCVRGVARAARGDVDGALADYAEAMKLDPRDGRPYYNRALLQLNRRRYDDALTDYDKALALDPRHAAAYVNRGALRDAKGDLAGALADYEKAIALAPHLPQAYVNRGNLRWKKDNDLDAAIRDYDEAIRRDARCEMAWMNRGMARYAKRDYAGCVEDLSKALAVAPSGWEKRAECQEHLDHTRQMLGKER
jgi:tetratricopeptide (TPR) repeat protein